MKAVLRSLSLLVVLMLAACSQVAPTATLTPTATPNPSATPTASATPTITPSPTPTFTPTPTVAPTEVKLAYETIGPENGQKLSLINVIGFGEIQDIKYSLDGSQIAIVSNLKTCIYNASTFEQLRCLGPVDPGSSILLSDDFSTLLIGGGMRFSVVDIKNDLQVEHEISEKSCDDPWANARIKAISADNRLAIIGICNKYMVWDLIANQEIPNDKPACNIYFDKFSFSPRGDYLIKSVDNPYTDKDIIELLTFPDLKKVKNFYPDVDNTERIIISPDQQFFAVSGADNKPFSGGYQLAGGTKYLHVFSVEGKLVHRVENVESYGFLQDGSLFYDVVGGVLNEYDTSVWGYPISSQKSPAWTALAPDKSSAIINSDKRIEFWHQNPLRLKFPIAADLDSRVRVQFSHDIRYFRFTPDNRAIWVGSAKYDLLTGKELKRIDLKYKSAGPCSSDIYYGVQAEEILKMDISMDERYAAYVTDCSRLVLLDLKTGQEHTLRPYGSEVGWTSSLSTHVLFTPDNKYLVDEYYKTGLTLYPLTDLAHPIYLPHGILSIWIEAEVISSSDNWSDESQRAIPHDQAIFESYRAIDPNGIAYYMDMFQEENEPPVIWKSSRNSQPIQFESDQPGRIFIMEFIPKTSLIVGRIVNGYVTEYFGVWDLNTGKLLKKFPLDTPTRDMSNDFIVSPDGTMIAVVEIYEGGLQIWGIPQP